MSRLSCGALSFIVCLLASLCAGCQADVVSEPEETKLGSTQQAVTEASTTLVHVQLDESGRVLMNYVRGGSHFTSGYPQFAKQLLALPEYIWGEPNRPLAAPSAILDTMHDQMVVATAHVSSASLTTIHVIRAGYADHLPEATPSVLLTRPLAIRSPVQLTRWGADIAALWVEGSALMHVRSVDGGATWTQPAVLGNLSITGQFAVTSSGNDLYVILDALDAGGGLRTLSIFRIDSSGAASSLGSVASWFGSPPLRGLSIAVDNGDLFSAYATSKTITVVKWPGFQAGSAQSSTVRSIPKGISSEHFSVTIQPSPYGWALQYVERHNTTSGVQYSTFGFRSSDGLNYPNTPQWLWQTVSSFTGGTSMSLTPVATPWIHQLHSSGADKNSVYNFIITAEGYSYAERAAFFAEAQILAANLLSRAPFSLNKHLINIFAVASYSKDSYYDDEDWGARDTMFDAWRNGDSTTVVARKNPMAHAIRMIHDRTALGTPPRLPTTNYGVTIYNSPSGKMVAIAPWDSFGVAVDPEHTNGDVIIHEFMHTHDGAFALGDHERFNQPSNYVNKSLDGRMSPTADPPHAWQEWFTFTSPAVSRLIPVTDAFRANQNLPPYSSDPASASFVSALDYLNPGLWESWRFVDANTRQYAAHHTCMMNTNAPRTETFCPICSEIVTSVLTTQAGGSFSRAAFRGATGSYLEFPLQSLSGCGHEQSSDASFNLTDLIRVRSGSGAWTTVPASAIEKYDTGGDLGHSDMGRVNLMPWLTPGQIATVAFQPRLSSDPGRFVYLPSVQLVNSKGARYAMQPADTAITNALLSKVYAANCDHMHWDLAANGELRLTFMPQ